MSDGVDVTTIGFDTAKTVFATRTDKCHVSHVAEDSGWESKLAQMLESMDEVHSYVKNQGLQFTIPYSLNGEDKQYFADFIARIGEARGGPAPARPGNGRRTISRRNSKGRVLGTATIALPGGRKR